MFEPYIPAQAPMEFQVAICTADSAVTLMTAHFTCGLMSGLVICKHTKEYGHPGHEMSLLRSGVIEQHKHNFSLGSKYNM